MSTTFCPTCMKDTDVRIEDRRETLPVRGEDIEIEARVAVCSTCGEDVWLDELEDETLALAFAEYRRRHHLLQPEEMQRIRRLWGLGQRAFAQLLGWGEITLHRYESGSLQDGAHDAQLRMAERPENIRTLLESNGGRLTPRQRDAVMRRLDEAEALAAECECGDEDFERLVARRAAGGYGGNAPLSLTKVRETIAYFAAMPDMFVTKLAKLMFYADFLHYREHTISITGLAYAHAPQGPIPDRYERIRDDVIVNAVVEIQEKCGDNWSGEVLVAQRPADLGVFSESELAMLQAVRERLGARTSKRLSEMSHAETAWTATAMGERIPYETARQLSPMLPEN
ncbi:MAG: type II TA system antitoxin MqsA family protein [Actinomycetes bacterium]